MVTQLGEYGEPVALFRSAHQGDEKSKMSNVVSLHAGKRWRAVITYRTSEGQQQAEHFFEEISDLHQIIEHGPDWNMMVYCMVTLNRTDDGETQNSIEKALSQGRPDGA